jgi:hypothetical protein
MREHRHHRLKLKFQNFTAQRDNRLQRNGSSGKENKLLPVQFVMNCLNPLFDPTRAKIEVQGYKP